MLCEKNAHSLRQKEDMRTKIALAIAVLRTRPPELSVRECVESLRQAVEKNADPFADVAAVLAEQRALFERDSPAPGEAAGDGGGSPVEEPGCRSLLYLQAVSRLQRTLGGSGDAEESAPELDAAVDTVLRHVSEAACDAAPVWLSLHHGLELAARLLAWAAGGLGHGSVVRLALQSAVSHDSAWLGRRPPL
ncbi:uncharacterized protein LOC119089957 [Pollicipes pollicipes]|uniref:uncharacterized protein LOC119089957 n=1 Tax=Pollicipes pollicipes TaxID=41117 RepID=UPI001884B26E|nr:uncharacterized protein LOC119089957 [Pollicipes pollicipes]